MKKLNMNPRAEEGEIVLTSVQLTRIVTNIRKFLNWIAILLVVLTIVNLSAVSISGYVSHRDNHKTNIVIADQRLKTEENRITACNTQRQVQLGVNHSIEGTENLVNSVYSAFNTPEATGLAVKYIKELEAYKIPTKDIRKCSTKDIEAYYGNKP